MHKKGHITVYQCITLSLNLRLQALLHTADIKIKYSVPTKHVYKSFCRLPSYQLNQLQPHSGHTYS